MSIETIGIIITVLAALIGAAFLVYLYFREKTLEDIRGEVYKLFLQAEHTYLMTGSGKQKMKWVIGQVRGMLPVWAQIIITDDLLEKVIEGWFRAVKDLLDDGKMNKSTEVQQDGK